MLYKYIGKYWACAMALVIISGLPSSAGGLKDFIACGTDVLRHGSK